MLTIEDVRESYQDYLEENRLTTGDYSFMDYVRDNYDGEYIVGL